VCSSDLVHPVEVVGQELRGMMSWLKARR